MHDVQAEVLRRRCRRDRCRGRDSAGRQARGRRAQPDAVLGAARRVYAERVTVRLTTDLRGFDVFHVHAVGLPPNTTFTAFLLEQARAPFGAAEYIGDFTSDDKGRADNTFRLIVAEAFASTLVNGQRVRVDLNQVGAWFADPTGDDFCLGPDSPVTPFDGDNEAGVQAFNSANTTPLPPP